jgi:hypothetical protein
MLLQGPKTSMSCFTKRIRGGILSKVFDVSGKIWRTGTEGKTTDLFGSGSCVAPGLQGLLSAHSPDDKPILSELAAIRNRD